MGMRVEGRKEGRKEEARWRRLYRQSVRHSLWEAAFVRSEAMTPQDNSRSTKSTDAEGREGMLRIFTVDRHVSRLLALTY